MRKGASAALLLASCATGAPGDSPPDVSVLCRAPAAGGVGTVRRGPIGSSFRVPGRFRLTGAGRYYRLYETEEQLLGVALTEHPLGLMAEGHHGLELLRFCTADVGTEPVLLFFGRWGNAERPIWEIQAEWTEPIADRYFRLELHTRDSFELMELRRVIWSVRKGTGTFRSPPAGEDEPRRTGGSE